MPKCPLCKNKNFVGDITVEGETTKTYFCSTCCIEFNSFGIYEIDEEGNRFLIKKGGLIDDNLEKILFEAEKKIGKIPTVRDLRKLGISVNPFIKKCGSYMRALELIYGENNPEIKKRIKGVSKFSEIQQACTG